MRVGIKLLERRRSLIGGVEGTEVWSDASAVTRPVGNDLSGDKCDAELGAKEPTKALRGCAPEPAREAGLRPWGCAVVGDGGYASAVRYPLPDAAGFDWPICVLTSYPLSFHFPFPLIKRRSSAPLPLFCPFAGLPGPALRVLASDIGPDTMGLDGVAESSCLTDAEVNRAYSGGTLETEVVDLESRVL